VNSTATKDADRIEIIPAPIRVGSPLDLVGARGDPRIPIAPWAVDPRARSLRELLLRLFPRSIVSLRLRRRERPTVLLTFDDGPHPVVTRRVLECLERHGARALFFIVGRHVRSAPGVVQEIVARGHLLGNHSYLHHNRRFIEERPPFRFYLSDARRCQNTLLEQAGRAPRLFRPPGGKVTPTTLLVPLLLGMRGVHWSIDSNDWHFRTPGEVQAGVQALLARIAPRDIVLLHDNRPTIIDLLEGLLPALAERGFDLWSGIEDLN
jgi:peptidoglycan/xylan/chitin deacetylase (PgdA/CDA1 family)